MTFKLLSPAGNKKERGKSKNKTKTLTVKSNSKLLDTWYKNAMLGSSKSSGARRTVYVHHSK